MRERIEQALGRWGRFVYRRAWWVLTAILLATAAFATNLQHFYLDASNEGFFHADDPIRVRYDAFREAYGRETLIVIALKPEAGVFDAGFLATLRALHEQLEEEVPYLSEVTSLVNARDTRGLEDRLEVGDFLEDWPETPEALADVEARARANRLYRNNLLSADGRTTTVVLETDVFKPGADPDGLGGFDDDDDGASGFDGAGGADEPTGDGANPDDHPFLGGEYDAEIVAAIEPILARHRSPGLEIRLAGTPAFTTRLAANIQGDMGRFTALCIGLIALFLAVLFRRVGAVVLPIVTVALTVITTLALMAATGTPVMPPTQIIPSFLLAVGVGGAVHLLAIFYQARRRGEDEESAVSHALSHSGLPIIMTCLTTAGGLLSFVPAALRPISHFGTFTPVGVIVSLFFTLTLLPALIAVFPMRPAEARRDDTVSQRLLLRVGALATRRAGQVIAVWAVLLVLSGVGITRLVLNHHMLEWFPHEDEIYQATTFVNDALGGAISLEVALDTGEENGFHDPEFLANLDRAQDELASLAVGPIATAKTLSLTDVVKETHQALNENREAFYAIPAERALVAQELLLFENAGSDDMEDFVDSQFSSGRLSIRLPFADAASYDPYIDAARAVIERHVGPEIGVETTGMMRLMANTVTAALQTMVFSYASAFVVITLLMVLLIGRLRIGLVAMIPNLAPIVVTLGLMGWIGIPLDMFTLMIGTIALGLAVDDTIHFMHNFRRYFDESGDAFGAVQRTLRTAGQAMLFTSLVLASGFLVYTLAYMANLVSFGLLTATAISLAFVSDVTLAPALVTTLARK